MKLNFRILNIHFTDSYPSNTSNPAYIRIIECDPAKPEYPTYSCEVLYIPGIETKNAIDIRTTHMHKDFKEYKLKKL